MHRANGLSLGADRALYTGELPATGWHSHAAPVLLVGLSGRFALQLPGGRCESCRSALVDAGVFHAFDPCGEQVALMYLEPDAPELCRLRPLLAAERGLLFDAVRPAVSAGSMQERLRSFDLQALLPAGGDVLPLDPRVAFALRLLRTVGEHPLQRAQAAGAVELSASRFNHLFREQTGTSFRSYRVWSQVRAALAALATERNLTGAALQGGFADSAHFSRSFRATFGMTPSSLVKPLQRVVVL